MSQLPEELENDPTLEAADKALEDEENSKPSRTYLGMSSIGRPCERELWYSFRWTQPAFFNAETHRRFIDGHMGEDLQATRLRKVKGVTLKTIDPRTGQQFGFVDLGGHFRGHLDGDITGLLQAPKTPHIWEHKQVSESKFTKLVSLKEKHGEKNALAKWDETYYAQAVMYMYYGDRDRHYLTVSTPGGRITTSCRTDRNNDAALRFREKAKKIIFSVEPPARINDNPSWYQCKMCSYNEQCHGNRVAQPSCRTCVHVTPKSDGSDGVWFCEKYGCEIDTEHQRKGCRSHVMIPSLVPFAKPVDAGEDHVVYSFNGKTFINGQHGKNSYTSWELYSVNPEIIGNDVVEQLRNECNAEIVKG